MKQLKRQSMEKLQSKGCHWIYFVFLAVTGVGKWYPRSKYEYVTAINVNDVSFSENVTITFLYLDKTNETISIVDGVSVNTEEINYKTMLL